MFTAFGELWLPPRAPGDVPRLPGRFDTPLVSMGVVTQNAADQELRQLVSR